MLNLDGDKRMRIIAGGGKKKNLERVRHENPLSHVGGINAHASVGESKEHEGGDGINLVAVE